VSLRLEITAPYRPAARASTVGVDVGIGQDLLIVMRRDGTVAEKVTNPRALRAALARIGRETVAEPHAERIPALAGRQASALPRQCAGR
jgi:hypothetical protein